MKAKTDLLFSFSPFSRPVFFLCALSTVQAYDAAMAQTDELLPQLNAALAELEGMIHSETACSEVGLGYDDIDLWSRLRSVTLVDGAEFGPKTKAYLENLSEMGDVPLYFGMKC